MRVVKTIKRAGASLIALADSFCVTEFVLVFAKSLRLSFLAYWQVLSLCGRTYFQWTAFFSNVSALSKSRENRFWAVKGHTEEGFSNSLKLCRNSYKRCLRDRLFFCRAVCTRFPTHFDFLLILNFAANFSKSKKVETCRKPDTNCPTKKQSISKTPLVTDSTNFHQIRKRLFCAVFWFDWHGKNGEKPRKRGHFWTFYVRKQSVRSCGILLTHDRPYVIAIDFASCRATIAPAVADLLHEQHSPSTNR